MATTVSLTVQRLTQVITVGLQWHDGKWFVITSLDENGHDVRLTLLEKAHIKARARQGEDETGR